MNDSVGFPTQISVARFHIEKPLKFAKNIIVANGRKNVANSTKISPDLATKSPRWQHCLLACCWLVACR